MCREYSETGWGVEWFATYAIDHVPKQVQLQTNPSCRSCLSRLSRASVCVWTLRYQRALAVFPTFCPTSAW